jgi:hypothetical protein
LDEIENGVFAGFPSEKASIFTGAKISGEVFGMEAFYPHPSLRLECATTMLGFATTTVGEFTSFLRGIPARC